MNKPDTIYILLDFSCGRFYTHHSSYLSDFQNYLKKLNLNCEIWVNTSADKELIENLGARTKPVLRSIMYSFNRHQDFLRFLQDKSISSLFMYLSKIKVPSVFYEWLQNAIAYFYFRSALKELKSISFTYQNIVLIFPTFDALSFRLTKYISERTHFPIKKICIRVTGAEKRGAFAVQNSESKLFELCESNPTKINLGIEVNNYVELLSIRNREFKKLFWAPMPEVQRTSLENIIVDSSPSLLKIGFLGSARKTKGFEDLPIIFSTLIENNVNFRAYIQLPNFFWDEAKSVLSILKNEYWNYIEIIPGGSPKKLIDGYIAKMDLVLLPYSEKAYKYAGSGILFLAADLETPIFTHQRLAFAWDVEGFKIGETYTDYTNLALKLKKFNRDKYTINIKKYNLSRNKATDALIS